MSTPSTSDSSSLLRHRNYVLFWFARTTSAFAFQMISIAVGWQIYSITNNPFDLGLIGLAQFFPSVLLAIPAGFCSDRFNRRIISIISLSVEMLMLVLLTYFTFIDRIHEHGILLMIFILSTARVFEGTSIVSLLPNIVPRDILPKAIAVNSSAMQAAMILGPALGGFLYILGPSAVYGTATTLYLLAIALLFSLQYVQQKRPPQNTDLKTIFAGISFIRSHKDVLGVISLDLFAVLLGGITALLPMFARDILHTDSSGLGLLRAAPAAGAILMSVYLARNQLNRNVGKIMFGAVAGFGVATIVFSISQVMWLSLAALFALGAFDMVSMVIRSSLVQLDTPDDMRGRVNAVNSIFINTSNQLGAFESGITAAWFGAVGAGLLGGIGTIVVVLVWMRLFPHLRDRQKLSASS